MEFKVYFSVGGFDFDAKSFSERVDVSGSRVIEIGSKSIGTPREREFFKNTWESRAVRVATNPENAALQLMREIIGPLRREIPERGVCTKWLKLVVYFEEGEQPRGFSFPSELLAMLASLEASLELDAVNAP